MQATPRRGIPRNECVLVDPATEPIPGAKSARPRRPGLLQRASKPRGERVRLIGKISDRLFGDLEATVLAARGLLNPRAIPGETEETIARD